MRILFMGDVSGKAGRAAISKHLPDLRKKLGLDFVICNAENAAGGLGLTPDTADELYKAGCDVLTLGNHTFDKKEIEPMLAADKRLLRPANYPSGTLGRGFAIYTAPNGKKIAVFQVIGRMFMEMFTDCPFRASRELMAQYTLGDDYHALVVDVHAEATSEKAALGLLWDGKASLVTGSHTHVPTADTRILPHGTGFHTDAGMCGDYDSIIGVAKHIAALRFETKGKHPQLATAEGDGTLCGTYAEIAENGLCTRIEMVRVGGVLQPFIPSV